MHAKLVHHRNASYEASNCIRMWSFATLALNQSTRSVLTETFFSCKQSLRHHDSSRIFVKWKLHLAAVSCSHFSNGCICMIVTALRAAFPARIWIARWQNTNYHDWLERKLCESSNEAVLLCFLQLPFDVP